MIWRGKSGIRNTHPHQISTPTPTNRHDDVGFRIHATRQLPRIARALGAERTREELIPFVVDSTDDEDEVLLTLAEAFGALYLCVCCVNMLGGAERTQV